MIDQEGAELIVLVNAEEQYSIWPAHKAIPDGWRADGFRGPRAACVAHVDEMWTDMRPKSLRDSMAAC
jgi:MbtH protein